MPILRPKPSTKDQKFWARALWSVEQGLQVILIHALENCGFKAPSSGYGLYLRIPFLQRSVLLMTNVAFVTLSDVGLPDSPGHAGHPVFAPNHLPAHNRMPGTHLALRGRDCTDIDCQPPGGHELPWGGGGGMGRRGRSLKDLSS